MITIVWHALQPHSKFIEMDWHFWTVITTLIIDISRNCFRTYSSRALQGQERHHERFLVWVHIKKIDTSQQRSQARADWNNCVSEQDIFLYHSHCRLLEMLECSMHIALLLCADFGIHTHTHTKIYKHKPKYTPRPCTNILPHKNTQADPHTLAHSNLDKKIKRKRTCLHRHNMHEKIFKCLSLCAFCRRFICVMSLINFPSMPRAPYACQIRCSIR